LLDDQQKSDPAIIAGAVESLGPQEATKRSVLQMKFWKHEKRIPTDLELLNAIYDQYHETYVKNKERPINYVSIDISKIAGILDAEPNSIFGRIYYHLQQKYGYEKMEDNKIVKVVFFDIEVGGKRHCIHFPLMMSVLAGLRTEHRESRTALWTSILAIVASAAGLAVPLMS
jgi:hypothetical protein